MPADKHSLSPVTLRFRDSATEEAYAAYTLERTLNFARIAWSSVILLAAAVLPGSG